MEDILGRLVEIEFSCSKIHFLKDTYSNIHMVDNIAHSSHPIKVPTFSPFVINFLFSSDPS